MVGQGRARAAPVQRTAPAAAQQNMAGQQGAKKGCCSQRRELRNSTVMAPAAMSTGAMLMK